MAQSLADLQAAITAVDAKVTEIGEKLADLSTDFDAAIAKLEADIAAGGDLTPSITALSDIATKVGNVSDALTAIDVKAETITGNPTP